PSSISARAEGCCSTEGIRRRWAARAAASAEEDTSERWEPAEGYRDRIARAGEGSREVGGAASGTPHHRLSFPESIRPRSDRSRCLFGHRVAGSVFDGESAEMLEPAEQDALVVVDVRAE